MNSVWFLTPGKVNLIIGGQWGDEGKGNVTSNLALYADWVIRYNSGGNAGHTITLPDKTTIATHLIPSGFMHPQAKLGIGTDVRVCPIILKQEIELLKSKGFDVSERVFISSKASLVLPYHKQLDGMGSGDVGSTKQGMAYVAASVVLRESFRLMDFEKENFRELIQAFVEKHEVSFDKEEYLRWFEAVEYIYAFLCENFEQKIRDSLSRKETILAEGAQGVMLDIIHGDYPYVTSAITTAHGIFSALAIGPNDIGRVYIVFKPYITKVGGGSFPSRMSDSYENAFRSAGNEVGSTTGRHRMVGYPDFVQMRYALELHQGFSDVKIILTKVDVVPEGVDSIKFITKYLYGDNPPTNKLEMPLEDVLSQEMTTLPIWRVPQGETDWKKVTDGLQSFLKLMSLELKDIPFEIAMITTGPSPSDYAVET